MQNGSMESFNGKLRDECLNTSWFWNLFDAMRKITAWRVEYNSRRPHSSLAYRTPGRICAAVQGCFSFRSERYGRRATPSRQP